MPKRIGTKSSKPGYATAARAAQSGYQQASKLGAKNPEKAMLLCKELLDTELAELAQAYEAALDLVDEAIDRDFEKIRRDSLGDAVDAEYAAFTVLEVAQVEAQYAQAERTWREARRQALREYVDRHRQAISRYDAACAQVVAL